MKLGEMLVRDGRLTEPQLELALKYQARDGGRLGTVLVEHGFVDLEALTVYLGLELGIPIATGAMLERAKRAAVRLLQPAQAFKHKCIPLVVQDRQLITAIEDPHDFGTLEALNQITGYRVLPRVTPEVRIYYYIERYYGVPRPARYLKFGDTPRGDEGAIDTGLPAPPLPGLPPVPASPVVAPGPRPRLRSTKMQKMFDDSEALELEAEDLIDTLDADAEAPAEAAPIAETPPAPSAPTYTRPRRRRRYPPRCRPTSRCASSRSRPIAIASSRCCSATRWQRSMRRSCSRCATTSRSAGRRSVSYRVTRTSSTS
jgi:hypothetical protein